jgi:hypothetical protein
LDLVFDLARHHKNMSIILRKAAHTEQAMQSTGQFMTMYQSKLAGTDR